MIVSRQGQDQKHSTCVQLHWQICGRFIVGGSFAEGIGGSIAVKQMDEGAGDALMFTGMGLTGLKDARVRK